MTLELTGTPPLDGGVVRVAPIVDAQRADVLRLLAADPYVGAAVEARVRSARGLRPALLGGEMYGAADRSGRLRALVLDAGAVQPVGGGPAEWTALARHLAGSRRRCSSIVGRAEAVATMWRVLEPYWGVARAVRGSQPLLVTSTVTESVRPVESAVRLVRMAELDAYLPAAAAMFREELGIDPARGPGGQRDYRARIAGLISARRAYASFDDGGAVAFKADLGCVTSVTCQVQGVWTRPDLRGRGVAAGAMPAVLAAALAHAPTVSLYVNDYNDHARRLYRRLGMTEIAQLATVLF